MLEADEARALVDQFLPEAVALQTAIMAGISEADRTRLQRTLAKLSERIDSIDADTVAAAARPRRRPTRGG